MEGVYDSILGLYVESAVFQRSGVFPVIPLKSLPCMLILRLFKHAGRQQVLLFLSFSLVQRVRHSTER